jgi:hypothetical protein
MNVSEEHAVSITTVWTSKSQKIGATSPFEVAAYSERLQSAIITQLIQIPSDMLVCLGSVCHDGDGEGLLATDILQPVVS